MIRNYFKIALRNLVKNKVYSFINISGLALGLAVSMLILLYVSHEVSFDKFHKNQAKIYQIEGVAKLGENEFHVFGMTERLGNALKEAAPSVVQVGRKTDYGISTFETDRNHRYSEEGLIFADEGFFKVFDFKILQGNAASLINPYTLMLTPQMAEKYFGQQNPVGKTLKWNKDVSLEIVGIVESNPSNSSIKYNFIASLPTLISENKKQYPSYFTDEKLNKIGLGNSETFLVLDKTDNAPNILNVLRRLAAPNPDNENISYKVNHFASTYLGYDLGLKSERVKYVLIFSVIATLILLLALINFMNLTTARATTRAKEVGVRKSIGANQGSLAIQFYMESTLTILIALFVGLVLFQMLRPAFYQILDLQIDTTFLFNPYFIASFIGIFLTTILLSGSYPAFILSRFNPIQALKGSFKTSGNVNVRQSLTIFQLAVSVGLTFCSIVIFSQIKQMRNKHLGLNKDQMMVLTLDEQSKAKNEVLRNQIAQIEGVEGVAGSQMRIFEEGFNMRGIRKINEKDENKNVAVIYTLIDKNYIDLYQIGWKMKPNVMPTDLKNKVILNEAAAKQIDKNIASIKQLAGFDTDLGAEMVGVVKDFNYVTVKQQVEPFMFTLSDDYQQFGFLNIKINKTADVAAIVAKVKQLYAGYKTDQAFAYQFADQSFDKLFKSEERIANMFGAFTGIAIFIACLGLFGLATFVSEQKTKEIGIRKVLGASVLSITILLSKNFAKLILIAIVIASPIAYYVMDKWLADFAHKTDIEWWFFAVAGLMVVLVAFATVSYQAIKAALMNPVESLKTE
jgi:putative ABC transport system permease protein